MKPPALAFFGLTETATKRELKSAYARLWAEAGGDVPTLKHLFTMYLRARGELMRGDLMRVV